MNSIVESIKKAIQNVKSGNISLAKSGNIWFIRITVILLIIPIVEVIGMHLYMVVFENPSDSLFKLIDYGLKIINQIWGVPVVTGILAYASRLVDKDDDGISDTDEKENSNVVHNITKYP